MRPTIDKRDLRELRSFFTAAETNDAVKREPTEWESLPAVHPEFIKNQQIKV